MLQVYNTIKNEIFRPSLWVTPVEIYLTLQQ